MRSWTLSRWLMESRNLLTRKHKRSKTCLGNKSGIIPSPRPGSSMSGVPFLSIKAKFTNVKKKNNNCSYVKVRAATTKVLKVNQMKRYRMKCSREPN